MVMTQRRGVTVHHNFFDFYGTLDAHRLSISSFHMDDKADDWFQELNATHSASQWADFVQALQARFSAPEKVENLAEVEDNEEEQRVAEDPKHSTNTATDLVVVAYHLSYVIPPRISKSLKEQQILDRSKELDVVVRKHKWQWKKVEINARVEPSQEIEPLRHIDAGEEVGKGKLSSAILALDRQILLGQHSGNLEKNRGSEVLPSCRTRRNSDGGVPGGFIRSKTWSRGSATKVSRCCCSEWEGTGDPLRRVDSSCPSPGRGRGNHGRTSAGRGNRSRYRRSQDGRRTGCLRTQASWPGTRTEFGGWPASKG
jgi:hypothetical protein